MQGDTVETHIFCALRDGLVRCSTLKIAKLE